MVVLGAFNAAMVFAGFIWIIAKLCNKLRNSKNQNPQKKPLLDERGKNGMATSFGSDKWNKRNPSGSILKSKSIHVQNHSKSNTINEVPFKHELTNQKVKKTQFAAIPEEPILL